MLQAVGLSRRILRAAVRPWLYPLFSVVLAGLVAVLFPAAAIWVRWDRWRTRRQILRLIARRGVAR